MDEHLRYYLESTLVTEAAIESGRAHLIIQRQYPTRLAYTPLQKYADNFLTSGSEPRFVSLAGLRGVGKTTLLWQAAHHIFISNVA